MVVIAGRRVLAVSRPLAAWWSRDVAPPSLVVRHGAANSCLISANASWRTSPSAPAPAPGSPALANHLPLSREPPGTLPSAGAAGCGPSPTARSTAVNCCAAVAWSRLTLAMGEIGDPARLGEGRAFVGRDREMAELAAALEDAVGGRGRLLLVTGEPGIGKTWLAEHLAERALQRGVRVRSLLGGRRRTTVLAVGADHHRPRGGLR
jgi:hypothetical protein